MNQLANIVSTAELKASVEQAFVLMQGLKTYGKLPSLDAWSYILDDENVTPAEIEPLAKEFAKGDRGDSFPDPGTFWQIIKARRVIQRDRDLTAEVAIQDAEIDRQRREINMLKYGTEEPSREQINARLKDKFGGNAVMGEIAKGAEIPDGPTEHDRQARAQIDRAKAEGRVDQRLRTKN